MREFFLGSSIFIGAIKFADADFYAFLVRTFFSRSLFSPALTRSSDASHCPPIWRISSSGESFEKFKATGHGELSCRVVYNDASNKNSFWNVRFKRNEKLRRSAVLVFSKITREERGGGIEISKTRRIFTSEISCLLDKIHSPLFPFHRGSEILRISSEARYIVSARDTINYRRKILSLWLNDR